VCPEGSIFTGSVDGKPNIEVLALVRYVVSLALEC
jgi:hypothetical protein